MKIILIGRGKMGRLIRETAHAAGDEVEAVFGHDDLEQLGRLGKVADVVIDFSRPEALPEICSYVRRTGTPLLSGTTGYSAAELEQLRSLGDCAPCCGAPTSLWVSRCCTVLCRPSPVC